MILLPSIGYPRPVEDGNQRYKMRCYKSRKSYRYSRLIDRNLRAFQKDKMRDEGGRRPATVTVGGQCVVLVKQVGDSTVRAAS